MQKTRVCGKGSFLPATLTKKENPEEEEEKEKE